MALTGRLTVTVARSNGWPSVRRRFYGRLAGRAPKTFKVLSPSSTNSNSAVLGRIERHDSAFTSRAAPPRSIASSDLDLGSHDDGALGREGESVARVGGVVGEEQEEVLAPHRHAVAVS
jgi:hypothetical protein